MSEHSELCQQLMDAISFRIDAYTGYDGNMQIDGIVDAAHDILKDLADRPDALITWLRERGVLRSAGYMGRNTRLVWETPNRNNPDGYTEVYTING